MYDRGHMEPVLWGEMKQGNSVPKAGIESISFAYHASVLTITPLRLPDVTTLLTPTWAMQLLAGEVSADYYNRDIYFLFLTLCLTNAYMMGKEIHTYLCIIYIYI